ncbi:hypothetical protein D3C86_1753090 [compost metagenome]
MMTEIGWHSCFFSEAPQYKVSRCSFISCTTRRRMSSSAISLSGISSTFAFASAKLKLRRSRNGNFLDAQAQNQSANSMGLEGDQPVSGSRTESAEPSLPV